MSDEQVHHFRINSGGHVHDSAYATPYHAIGHEHSNSFRFSAEITTAILRHDKVFMNVINSLISSFFFLYYQQYF